jgi:hypothetical protein
MELRYWSSYRAPDSRLDGIDKEQRQDRDLLPEAEPYIRFILPCHYLHSIPYEF